jgi:hypothetical protein
MIEALANVSAFRDLSLQVIEQFRAEPTKSDSSPSTGSSG